MRDASGPVEHILGSIRVTADIRAGSQFLRIFFTETRLIMAHVGRRGMGSMTTITLLGKLGSGFEGLIRGPGESRRKKKMNAGEIETSPGVILSIDKANFAISYDEIVQVSLERTPYSVEITMLTRDEKYRFTTTDDSSKVLKLFQDPLSTRVEVHDRDARRDKLNRLAR
jgi:hypothetical protein